MILNMCLKIKVFNQRDAIRHKDMSLALKIIKNVMLDKLYSRYITAAAMLGVSLVPIRN